MIYDVRYSGYPDAGDVEILLKSSKFWPTEENSQQLAREQAAIGAAPAADEWEKRLAYRDALVGYKHKTAQTRPFEMSRDGHVDFKASCFSIQGVTFGGRSIGNGNYEYELLNGEELAYEAPYTGMRFNGLYGAQWGGFNARPNRLEVTAWWGLYRTVPPFIWQQVLQVGALCALTSVENLQSIASIGQDDFNKAFDTVGIITQKDLLTTWAKSFLNSVQQYRRDVVFK